MAKRKRAKKRCGYMVVNSKGAPLDFANTRVNAKRKMGTLARQCGGKSKDCMPSRVTAAPCSSLSGTKKRRRVRRRR